MTDKQFYRTVITIEVLSEDIRLCNICGKPAEGEDTCECVCPKCGAHCFDDSCISDHGMCFDCHKKWQFEERGE